MKNLFKQIETKLIALISLLLFFSTNVLAQQSGGFGAPAAGDMSVEFLGQIFGGLVGGGNDAFGSSIATFNSAILIVGGILVGYTIFAGTLGTAHDGEMLGKKFSSVWVPIRTVLGTALVLPVMKGGYCTMQALVMWLVLQGISLANMVWTSYVGSAAAYGLQPTINTTFNSNIKTFVYDSYALAACVASYKQAEKETLSTAAKYFKDPDWKIWTNAIDDPTGSGVSEMKAKKLFGGNENSWSYFERRKCGQIIYPDITENNSAANTNQGQAGQNVQSKLTSIKAMAGYNIKVDTTPIFAAHTKETDNIISKVQSLAATAINDENSEKTTRPQLNALIKSYDQAINSAAQGAIGQVKDTLSEAAQSQGWFTAGTFATKIILVQNDVESAMMATGAATAKAVIAEEDTRSATKDVLRKYISNSRGWLDPYGGMDETNSENGTNDSTKKGKKESVQEDGKVAAFLTEMLVNATTSINFDKLQSDTRHPILIAQTMGNKLINWSIGLALTGAALAGGIGIASIGTLNGAIGWAASMFSIPIMGMAAVGGMLAYALPMIPFFLWIGIIIGWVLMVVEAIIAAPLWAVMHLHPYGDDMTGKGGSGYMLVLGLVVRPALIIFGLITAIVLSGLFGEYLNTVFLQAFTAPKTWTGFVTTLMMAVIYTVILMNIIKTTFSLMHKLPDQLLRWIGGGAEQLGQYASAMESGAMERASALAGGVIGAGSKLAGGAVGVAKQNMELDKGGKDSMNKENAAIEDETVKYGAEGGALVKNIADEFAKTKWGHQYSGMDSEGYQRTMKGINQDRATLKVGDPTGAAEQKYNQSYLEAKQNGKTNSEARDIAMAAGIDAALGEGASSKLADGGNLNGQIDRQAVGQAFNAISQQRDSMIARGIGGSDIAKITQDSIANTGNIGDALKEMSTQASSFTNDAKPIKKVENPVDSGDGNL